MFFGNIFKKQLSIKHVLSIQLSSVFDGTGHFHSAFDAVIAHTSFLHPNSPMESELIKDLIEALLIS